MIHFVMIVGKSRNERERAGVPAIDSTFARPLQRERQVFATNSSPTWLRPGMQRSTV